MLLSYSLCLILGYLIGSIPAGFLLVRWRRQIDLRTAGSGNVGAMNAFEVSGSGSLGTAVMLVDAAKGMLAVAFAWIAVGSSFMLLSVAAAGSVLGHNYPIWLRGKGGRGLATGAGAMVLVGWIFPVTWIILWVVLYKISRNIHIANILATIAAPVVIAAMPAAILMGWTPLPATRAEWVASAGLLSLLVLLRHIGPARDIWNSIHQAS